MSDSFDFIDIDTTTPGLDYIDMTPQNPIPTFQEGRVFYDSTKKALCYYSDISGSVMEIGFEEWVRARNSTGSTIVNGSPVVVSGATGQTPTLALADASVHHHHQVVGLVTNDIDNNTVNLVTESGEVNGLDTTGSGVFAVGAETWTDGDTLYVSDTAGKLTNVQPAWPLAAISVGIVSYAHASNGKILVRVGDAQSYLTAAEANAKMDKTGIGFDEATGAYDTTLTYNETTRTVTLAPTGANFKVYVGGVEYEKTTQTLTHLATGTGWFFYFDTTGTFVVSASSWDILTHAPVAFIFQDVTNSRRVCFEERHHAGRDVWWHRNQHFAEGTKITSAIAASGYTLNDGSTDAAVTWALSSFRMEDEDIRIDSQVFPDGGPYNLLRRVGATGPWELTRTAVLPYLYSGTTLQYNLDTAGTWSDATVTEDYYVNAWIFGFTSIPSTDYTPAPTTTQQVMIIAPQIQHSTEAAALAESFTTISWGTIPFQELVPLYRVTLRRNNVAPAAYTNTTRTAIIAFTRIVGTAATITSAASSSVSAGSVIFTPFGNISSITAQAAIEELDTEKLAKSGDTAVSLTITSADINGGTVDATTIGATTPAAGTFTTLASTGNATLGDDEATDTHSIKGATTLLSNSASAALTVTNIGTGSSLVVEDSASPDSTAFVIRNDGNVSIGSTGASSVVFYNQKPVTGSTTSYANYTNVTVQSDVTSNGYGYRTSLSTQAAAFTLTNLYHFAANQLTIGATSTVTSQYGFIAPNSLVGATNNYGFFSSIPASVGDWNFYAAGTASNYFAGLVDISASTAGQIKFPATQNASADANTLDDYEEGTWTPAFAFGTSGSVTYSTQVGTYTKVGRQVTVTGKLSIATVSSPLGTVTVSGTPFTAASGSGNWAGNALALSLASGAVTTAEIEGSTSISLRDSAGTLLLGSDLQAGTQFRFSLTYFV